MHKVTPEKHEDGTETVRLYGKTVDVTGKSKFTLFKREYKVYRPRKIEDIGISTEQASENAQKFSEAASKAGSSVELKEELTDKAEGRDG